MTLKVADSFQANEQRVRDVWYSLRPIKKKAANQHSVTKWQNAPPNLFLSKTWFLMDGLWVMGASRYQVKAGTENFSWSNELQRFRSHSASHMLVLV